MPRLRKQQAAPPAVAAPGRPLFEIDPEPRLVAALKQAFGHFITSDRAWIRVEMAMKRISIEVNPGGHDDFCRSYLSMDADDVIGFLVEHGLIEDQYQRAADSMTSNARKITLFLLQYGATKQADATTRSVIETETGLSATQVKAAIEASIARAAALLGTAIIEGKASHGSWLSAAGSEVAKRIDPAILKSFDA